MYVCISLFLHVSSCLQTILSCMLIVLSCANRQLYIKDLKRYTDITEMASRVFVIHQ